MKLLRKLLLILIIFPFSFSFLITSCEEDETEISGDSSLLVKNELSVSADIYFDGDFIGDVDDESSRTWSVPSGTHTVKAECSYKGDVVKTPTFPVGGTVTMTLYEQSGSANAYFSGSNY